MFQLSLHHVWFAFVCRAIVWLVLANQVACATDSLEERTAAAIELLESVELRFAAPDSSWFESTQQALRKETQRVSDNLDAQGEAYAAAWKQHLRWPLLVSNLGSPSEIDVEELALVRRWLYSNRQGLEYPFFAELRKRTDAHLDAAFTLTRPNLEQQFKHQVAMARLQLQALTAQPSDPQAAALGRTLGWLERTQQLPAEIAQVKQLVSAPNAQIVISHSLLQRGLALLAAEVEQTLSVSDRTTIPKSGLLSRSRVADVHGRAHTKGHIALECLTNAAQAELQLVYQGEIESHCRALVGPITLWMQTMGPVRAITPVTISRQGVAIDETQVFPQVHTRVTSVKANNALLKRLGERRSREPESKRQMNSRAKSKAANLLKTEMDERVTAALDQIRAELRQTQSSLDNLGEVLAPIVREGASPRWQGLKSSVSAITVNITSVRREQLGAPTTCPAAAGTADVQARFHVSFFNNMLETIMAGKTFTDDYFMNYGKILHAELPPPLMVHSRSTRWAVVATKPRPFEISIPAPNQFRIELRMQRVEIDSQVFTGPTTVTIHYVLQKNDFDEFELTRQGQVQLDSPLPPAQQAFLLSKFSAFFAPTLNGGGVALPEGGTLGKLRGLEPSGVFADRDWLALGVRVPTEFLEAWLPVPRN